MTATFDYYKLAHPEQGVGSGFIYKTVPVIRSVFICVCNSVTPGQFVSAIFLAASGSNWNAASQADRLAGSASGHRHPRPGRCEAGVQPGGAAVRHEIGRRNASFSDPRSSGPYSSAFATASRRAFAGNESLWFTVQPYSMIAVKIIDDRGIESLKVIRVGED